MFFCFNYYCRYNIFRNCIKQNCVKKNSSIFIYNTKIRNIYTEGKNKNDIYEYNEDYRLLKRLQQNNNDDRLYTKNEEYILKEKKKYLKLIRLYHPDTYMKETNEQTKKIKEEIFILLYNKYKNFNKQCEDLNMSEGIDEFVYENEEEKNERMERYERYSEGKRNDVEHKHAEIYIIIGILFTFTIVFLICIYLPFNTNMDDEFYDENEINEKVQLVSCFYNPIMKRYEYLTDNFTPPSPQQLYYFYKNKIPNMSINDDILKLNSFEILKLPKNRAKKCRLVYDEKTGELIFLKKKKEREDVIHTIKHEVKIKQLK
ncbi:conserved protein, unknown function [Hepatocystis sp. ex Piliocolobus tephrosceles]|nr:conserved protein, unknown function [Hepatocystis sp. ex Piliocolobus tephrosceles]